MKSAQLLLPQPGISFLLVGLLGSLGLLALHHLGGGGLDDSHSHGLPHVTDSEPGQSWVKRNIQRKVRFVDLTFRGEGSQ